ncbi:MAG: CBS domain-containing protein [bacterium]|nr:CBS domain-containing protein [bacterium]
MTENSVPEKPVENTEGRILALMEVVVSLLALEDEAQLRRLINDERGADVADVLRRVDDETRQKLFGYLHNEQAAGALVESDTLTQRALIDELGPESFSNLVEEMAPDDAADVLAELDEQEVAQVLTFMEPEEARELKDLLGHEEDTGGGLMTPDFVLVNESATVGDALKALQDEEEAADLFYVFVVDDDNRPVGAISIHKLVRARPGQPVKAIMTKDVVSVRHNTDQEEIARIFGRYNLMAMPVVDDEGRLIGRITADDVMDVMDEENEEDIFKMAGTSQGETEHLSVLRLPVT